MAEPWTNCFIFLTKNYLFINQPYNYYLIGPINNLIKYLWTISIYCLKRPQLLLCLFEISYKIYYYNSFWFSNFLAAALQNLSVEDYKTAWRLKCEPKSYSKSRSLYKKKKTFDSVKMYDTRSYLVYDLNMCWISTLRKCLQTLH